MKKKTIIFSVILAFLFSYQVKANDNYLEFIVKPKEKILKARRSENFLKQSGLLRFRKVTSKYYTIPLDKTKDTEKQINELNDTGLFETIEPNYKLEIDQIIPERNYTTIIKKANNILDSEEVTPNDSDFSSQYYLREINATKAWKTTVGEVLTVCILDTGVNAKHPDLTGKVFARDGFEGIDLNDEIGHGTEVAGIIAANTNNKKGIAGISWNTKILSVKITDEFGQARVSDVAIGLDEAYKNGAKIVQISLSTNQFSQTLKDIIKEAQDRGILIVSTAGNSGIQEIRYPAAFSGVIGVGAVNEQKERELYSTRGAHVSLVAPGTEIYTTSGNTYSHVSGTSFSAPQITGAAALVWSIAPKLTNIEVRDILIKSANDLGDVGKDPDFGYGLLNIERAVERAKEFPSD